MLHVLCGSKRNHFKLPMHHTILTPTARAIKPTLTSCSVQKQHACESCCDRKTSKKLSRFREMYRIEPTQKIEPEVPHSTDEDQPEAIPNVQGPPVPQEPPEIQIQKMIRALNFEEFGVHRRAALGLLPSVRDPECDSKMFFSRLKSDRCVTFLSEDNLTVTMDGGYRLCRASRAVSSPFNYFWEFKFAGAESSDSHVRLGIATLGAKLDRPVACDESGYCVRDSGGAFHNSMHEKPRESPAFGVGDVVGMGLRSTADGAEFRMWLNGVDCGALFSDVDSGKAWFPAVSIYRKAIVEGRFERPFHFDPGQDWTAANDAPVQTDATLFTSQELVAMMKGAPLVGDPLPILSAMDAALTPVNEMPI